MAASCPGVRRDRLENDDNVDGAGEFLVVVKFADAVGMMGEAEDNDNRAVVELAGGGSTTGNQGFQSRQTPKKRSPEFRSAEAR